MKNLIAILFVMLAFTSNSQQAPKQKVIVEVGTGTWCSACPYVVTIIEELLAEGAQIGIVEYHINDDYENAGSLIRKSYYDFPWYPTTYYDSDHIGYDDWATYSVHKEYYDNRWATPSSFTLAISGDIDGLFVAGNVEANRVAGYANDELTLHCVLTESNIEEYWQGLSELDYVERNMFPDGNGTLVDFSGSTAVNVPFEFTLDPSWEKENCKLVFFLQDNVTKEIVQGDQVDLLELPLQSGLTNIPELSNTFVYPNPFYEELYFENGAFDKILIRDISGRIIYHSDNFASSVNTTKWTPGIYFVSAMSAEGRKTYKVIKK